MKTQPRITNVSLAAPFQLALQFADGYAGVADLGPVIATSAGVFTALKDPAFFAQVSVDHDAGTVTWPNGVDLDPDVLYEMAHGVGKSGLG